jgi:hypothetical protein
MSEIGASNLPDNVTEADIDQQYAEVEPETTDVMLSRRYMSDKRNGRTTAKNFREWLKEYRGGK